MSIQLPQSRSGMKQIQIEKRKVPLEQILAVQGQNPLATGIETAGNVIGQTIQKRAELKKQGEQLAKLEALSGQKPGAFNGIDPAVAASLTGTYVKEGLDSQEKARTLAHQIARVKELEKQFGYKPGELGEDYDAAKLKIQADRKDSQPNDKESFIPVGTDAAGNVVVLGNKSASLKSIPLPGGGSVLPKNQPGVTQKNVKDIEEQQLQVQDLRTMLKDVPSGMIGGGLTSLASKATFGAVGGKTKQYNDLKPSIATKIYRAMTGDQRLSDADAASRAYPLLPDPAEPENVREAKLQNIELILNQRKEGLMTGGGLKQISTTPTTNEAPKATMRWNEKTGKLEKI